MSVGGWGWGEGRRGAGGGGRLLGGHGERAANVVLDIDMVGELEAAIRRLAAGSAHYLVLERPDQAAGVIDEARVDCPDVSAARTCEEHRCICGWLAPPRLGGGWPLRKSRKSVRFESAQLGIPPALVLIGLPK